MCGLSVKKDIRGYYEQIRSGDPEWAYLSAASKAKNIVEMCDRYPHRTILDIGSGEGAVLKIMSDQYFGERLYSLEISKAAIEAIREKNIPTLKACTQFDGYDIPYEDKVFDLAILTHVVEHLEHPRKMLYEASRVAKHVFIEVPLEYTLRLKLDYENEDSGHINFYSPKLIRRLVQTCGLQVMDERITNTPLPQWKRSLGRKAYIVYLPVELALRISPRLATTIFTYNCSMVCGEAMSSALNHGLVSSSAAVPARASPAPPSVNAPEKGAEGHSAE